MLYIIAAAVTPSIIGLVLCLVSLWLPDDGYFLSKPCDDQQVDWRRLRDVRSHTIIDART